MFVRLRFFFATHQAEEALLAARALRLDPFASLDRLLDRDERLRSVNRDGAVNRVERPALHERFDHETDYQPARRGGRQSSPD